jgi:UDP-N-acetylglucosamine 4,6-dehydratase
MTRFWITLDQGIELVLEALRDSVGGEMFVPKIPSMRILDIIRALSDTCSCKVIGIRPGEKINETLIHEDEGRNTIDRGDHFIILPQFEFEIKNFEKYRNAPRVPEGFVYKSNDNDRWLSSEELKKMIKTIEIE